MSLSAQQTNGKKPYTLSVDHGFLRNEYDFDLGVHFFPYHADPFPNFGPKFSDSVLYGQANYHGGHPDSSFYLAGMPFRIGARAREIYVQTVFSVYRNLLSGKMGELVHGAGVAHSSTKAELGTLWTNRYFWTDTTSPYRRADSVVWVNAWHHEQRLGLSYTFIANLKGGKVWRCGIQSRMSCYFPVHNVTVMEYFSNYVDTNAQIVRIRRENPFAFGYSISQKYRQYGPEGIGQVASMRRSFRPEIDWNLAFRNEFLLGKRQRSSVFLFIGANLLTRYMWVGKWENHYTSNWSLGYSFRI